MSESLRDLVVSLSLNTENFTRNIRSVNKQIQEAESYFKLASAGLVGFEGTAEGLSAKLTMLQRKLQLQKDVVGQYERALAQATSKLTECTTRQVDYATRLDAAKQKQAALAQQVQSAAATYEHYKTTLGENNLTTQVAKAQLDALDAQYKEATDDVKKLSGQNDALQKAAQNAADAVSTQQTQLNKAKAAVKETEAAIRSTNKELATVRSAWTAAGKSIEEFGARCKRASQTMISVGRSLSMYVTTPIVSLAASSVKASLDFESSFASVRKTVEATEEEFAELAQVSKQMSTEIASSTTTINEVMATGGQLGIANEHLQEFTKVMIDLGNCCEDLSADEAATSIAKFANVMGTDQGLFQNIGSTIVELGNNFATTEKPIAEMAQRLAGAGKQVGLTEPQVLGFAAALSSVGIQAQMGGSSLSKALIKMEVACATGGQALTDFATVCGVTEDQFKTLFESDPAAAFQLFITQLAKMDEEGTSAIAVLDEIGISEIRLRDTLLRSVNANELFARAQDMANRAWEENTALTVEANKRYATTASQLTNLKNKAVLLGQQLGDDLNPMLRKAMEGVSDFLDKLLEMDEAERMQVMRNAAIVASIGPVLLTLGKVTKGVGTLSTGIGKFATAVGKAGGGFKGFLTTLGKSPSVWLAIAAATIAATAAIADYVSGAKQAREALKGMQETADKWKDTAAETFYGRSEGLSFFGMSQDDFTREATNVKQWLDGLIAVWSDGQEDTDEIVSQWSDSFKSLTDNTRSELQKMKEDAQESGYTSMVSQLESDLATLDDLDAEIAALLKNRQNGYLSDGDKIRLQELIDTREAIEVKYRLTPADVDGFDTIRQKLEAEVARAQARGKDDADASVYENAVVAAAQGMAQLNSQIDDQYDKEFALIQAVEDSTARQSAMEELNAKYAQDRRAAAQDYAALLAEVVPKVWQGDDVQQAASDIETLTQKLRDYSIANETDKPAILEDLNAISSAMDEGGVTEYIGMLSQIQSLLDNGMTEGEIQAMFPEIDFTRALEQVAAIQGFLQNRELDLPGLAEMFGDALPEEVLKIAADLDLAGVQRRWDEFSDNPGAITTNAVIQGYEEADGVLLTQPKVEAFIDKYTEVREGADKSSLTPEGILAWVSSYAEVTNGADVSGLNPENVTAMVTAYEELASGADVTELKPDEITAYISRYLEEKGVDTSGLTPDNITAFVMAYQEAAGGALTSALTPDGITAMVARYAEAENIDLSQLSDAQVEAIVTRFAEATNCDKSALLENFTAYIDKYDDTYAEKPKLNMSVGIYGYDLLAYRQFVADNPVEVQGIVRLSEVYDDPAQALSDAQAKFYQDGVEIPVTAVPTEMLTPDRVAVLGDDGTLHILIAPEITGTQEAIDAISPLVDEVDKLGTTAAGIWAGLMPETTMDLISSAVGRINSYSDSLDLSPWQKFWAYVRGESVDQGVLDQSMKYDFNADTVAELSAYVGEMVAAIQQGKQVSAEDVENLQEIVTFLQGLDTTETGTHILEGVAEGMTAAGWDTDAETVASNLETALNNALGIHSPSERVKPVGDNVAAGVGVGMSEHEWGPDAEALAAGIEEAVQAALTEDALADFATGAMEGLAAAMSTYSMTATGNTVGANVRAAVSSYLNSTTLRSAGLNAMAGLTAGINAGRSGVVAAMRSAAQAAVWVAKSELKIHSPSEVFRDEVGVMTMRGLGEGIVKETRAQAKIIRNAARYLTGEARDGAIPTSSTDNRRTYNNSVNSTIQVAEMVVRDEQDIRALAVEIATLTRRSQRGKGLRMA